MFEGALALMFCLALCLGVVLPSHAQEENVQAADTEATEASSSPVDVSFGAMIKSGHLWNGGLSYGSLNMQADFTVSAYGLYFNTWGLMAINGDKEVDLCLGYGWNCLDICFIDMFYPNGSKPYNSYFAPIHPETNYHQGWVQFTFSGVEKFPIMFTAGAFVYGDFGTVYEPVLDDEGNPVLDEATGEPQETLVSFKERYSTYLALGYSHTIRTGMTLDYEVGCTPFKGAFAEGFNVVNIKCKMTQPVHITKHYAINLIGEWVFNPTRKELYFTAGIGF